MAKTKNENFLRDLNSLLKLHARTEEAARKDWARRVRAALKGWDE